MQSIIKNEPSTLEELNDFLAQVNFVLPVDFFDFFKMSNGADITTDSSYVILWPLRDMFTMNEGYETLLYAPGFFFFGSDGGYTAFAIEKKTGYIYEVPFIGMSDSTASFKCKTFSEFFDIIGCSMS